MLSWRSWGLGLALATGAFWIVMGHRPHVSVATPGAASFSSFDVRPGDMLNAESGNAF
jgi:hypothetical protein